MPPCSIQWLSQALLVVCFFNLIGCAAFDSSADKIRIGAEELAEGMREIDPLALNKLLADNKDLRDKLNEATVQLSRVSDGGGVIALKNRRLQLRVEKYEGAFHVDGFIDNKENVIWRADLPNMEKSLVLNIDEVISSSFKGITDRHCAPARDQGFACGQQIASKLIEPTLPYRSEFAASLAAYVNSVYRSELAGNNLGAATGQLSDDLQGSLGTEGSLHKITLVVTPLANGASSSWSMRIRLIEITGDGKELTHRTYDFSSGQFPHHKLSAPIDPYNIFVRVAKTKLDL